MQDIAPFEVAPAFFIWLVLIKEYDYFEFELKKVEPISFEYKLERPTILDTPYFFLDFCGDTSDRNVSFSDYPLTIRNIKKSDFLLSTEFQTGQTEVKDFLTNQVRVLFLRQHII